MAEHQYAQQPKKTDTIAQKQTTPPQITHKMQLPSSYPMAIIQRARINPKSLTHADVMQLQRTIGNRAVGQLLSEIGLIPSKAKQTQPVQMQIMPEEEKESLQGKFAEPIQRQGIPEEEPLQGNFENVSAKGICPSCIQRQESPEEEEPLQGKITNTIQLQEIPEEEEPLQGKFESIQRQEIQDEEPLQIQRENNTGMPDNLKAGVESLSGIDMSDVRVNYNSNKPADVGALAYTQGADIHVAPGQEKHLPHEAWHVVQQKQGRVQPTMQLKDGVQVNDDEGLEYEADVMGEKTLQCFVKLEPERHLPHEDCHVVQQMECGMMSKTQTIQAQFVGVLNLSNTQIRNLFRARYLSPKTDKELETRIQELRVDPKNSIGTIDELRLLMGPGFVNGNIPGQDAKTSITPNVNAFPPPDAQGRSLYRTDGRLESTIKNEGFFPKRMMGMGEIRELINSQQIDGFASAWITNPAPLAGLAVAFAYDENCGGQRNASDTDECVRKAPEGKRVQYRPVYRVKFPQMFIIRQKGDKSIIANNQNIQNATIIGIQSTIEWTIFTGVPGPLVNLHKGAE